MNLSHAYGAPPPREQGTRVLLKALELGVIHFDTAPLYGDGHNETLLGEVLQSHRDRIFLASKCGMTMVNGKKTIDGRPETLRLTLEESLTRLQTDHLDLCYLHRVDPDVAIEESIGVIVDFIKEGKALALGLSEASAESIRRAHAVHPVAALQSEFSLWTRNVEIAALQTCEELDIALVAYAPIARGFLANMELDPNAFHEKDIRRNMPRFQEQRFLDNRELLAEYNAIAKDCDCTPAQLALAWLLQRSSNIHVIPGTTSTGHLAENIGSLEVTLARSAIESLGKLINQSTITGPRYNAAQLKEVGTEDFPTP